MSLCPKLDPTHTAQLSFSQLRDQLLDLGPLNLDHIKKVNKAEAEFWKASEGERLGDSTDILGFDCGGEQLVMEFCFPIGTLKEQKGEIGHFVTTMNEQATTLPPALMNVPLLTVVYGQPGRIHLIRWKV